MIDAQGDLSPEDIKDLNSRYSSKGNETRAKTFQMLSGIGAIELSSEADYYISKKDECLNSIKDIEEEYTDLKNVLNQIQKDIEEFWENSQEKFENWAEEEMIARNP